MNNTIIHYFHRDESNYKDHEYIVVEGRITKEQLEEHMNCGEFFDPRMVGMRPLAESCSFCEGLDYHELLECKETDQAPDFEHTADELLELFNEANKNKWEFKQTYGRHHQPDYEKIISSKPTVNIPIETGAELLADFVRDCDADELAGILEHVFGVEVSEGNNSDTEFKVTPGNDWCGFLQAEFEAESADRQTNI